MKRVCTEEENRIIKKCTGDILASPKINCKRLRSSLTPVVLGALIGFAVGIVISLMLWVTVERVMRIIVIICTAAITELFVLIWNWQGKRKKHGNSIPGKRFWINGGTIVNYARHHREGLHLIFVEDDIVDKRGKLCCIKYPAAEGLKVRYGERILLVYSDCGAYIPLKITERTRHLISEYAPNFNEKALDGAVLLPHPAGNDLDNESSRMTELEIMEFRQRCNRFKSFSLRNWIGIGLFSFLIFILTGVAFILLAAEVITGFYGIIICFVVSVIIWLVLSFVFAKAVLAGHISGMKKVQYKKKVMFHSINDEFENKVYTKYVSVYEIVNGAIELVSYPIVNNNFLPKDTYYGKIIYKYSKDEKSCAMDKNFFLEK